MSPRDAPQRLSPSQTAVAVAGGGGLLWPGAEAGQLYGARLQMFQRRAAERASRAVPATTVAEAIEHALTSEKPRTRYVVGPDAKRRARLQRLPDRLRDRLLSRFLFEG